MNQLQKNNNAIVRLFSSPTLDTVSMVEETIKKYSGACNKTQIWEKLPKKVMWGTYKIILNYLENINKIGVAKRNILVHIWNPKVSKRFMELDRKKL